MFNAQASQVHMAVQRPPHLAEDASHRCRWAGIAFLACLTAASPITRPRRPALSVSLKLERELRWNDIPLKLRMAAASGKNRFSTAGNVDLSALTLAAQRFSSAQGERFSSVREDDDT